MTSNSTAAVVVTFNRKKLLCECLDALLQQSLTLDAIYVVDNGSTDGTGELLKERGYLDLPSIRYLALGENTGGAGGFHSGMAAAQRDGYDWIWVMDDDTEPHIDALEKTQHLKDYPAVVAIANRKVDSLGKATVDGLRLMPKSNADHRTYTLVRFSSFVGLLIRRSAMDTIGLPRPEFFIHNDDTEYCMRLRSMGDIALASESFVAHKEIARAQKGRKILSHTFYQKDIGGFCFGYFGHRNYAWIQRTYCKNAIVRYLNLAGRFAFFSAAVLAFDRDHRWLRIKILAKANLDGLRANFDNGFPQRVREQLQGRRKFNPVNNN